jgi:histone-lysine N-methyltransferase SUV39H
VVINLVYQTGMPYIVFVAACDITAGVEFTFDYNPKAAEQARERRKKKKGKRPEEIPEEAILCKCGSSECRGYL